MSAKYKCDICGRKLPRGYKKHEIFEEVDVGKTRSGVRRILFVKFSVGFRTDTEDMCISCALKTIYAGAKIAEVNINNINAMKHAENCQYG